MALKKVYMAWVAWKVGLEKKMNNRPKLAEPDRPKSVGSAK